MLVNRLLRCSVVLVMMMSLVSCVTPKTAQENFEIPSCCANFQPIFLDDRDSVETQDQILDYLIMYETLCEGEE